jgi:hypothetical protein
MSPNTNNQLTRLLTTFDVQRLGEGDMSAGANVIAAMACAIANIHLNGSRIASGDGPSFRIGSSVLAYGPLTSALIAELVESVLAKLQSNMDSHCNEWELAKEAYPARRDPSKTNELFNVAPNIKSLQTLQEGMSSVVRGSAAGLLTPMPNRMKRALLERPLLPKDKEQMSKVRAIWHDAFDRLKALMEIDGGTRGGDAADKHGMEVSVGFAEEFCVRPFGEIEELCKLLGRRPSRADCTVVCHLITKIAAGAGLREEFEAVEWFVEAVHDREIAALIRT